MKNKTRKRTFRIARCTRSEERHDERRRRRYGGGSRTAFKISRPLLLYVRCKNREKKTKREKTSGTRESEDDRSVPRGNARGIWRSNRRDKNSPSRAFRVRPSTVWANAVPSKRRYVHERPSIRFHYDAAVSDFFFFFFLNNNFTRSTTPFTWIWRGVFFYIVYYVLIV